MFIVAAHPRTALQRSAMCPCSNNIRLRRSRNELLGDVAINIWSLRDPGSVSATHYYPTTREIEVEIKAAEIR